MENGQGTSPHFESTHLVRGVLWRVAHQVRCAFSARLGAIKMDANELDSRRSP